MKFIDEENDFEDVDCKECGMKFYVRPSLYTKEAQAKRVNAGLAPKEWPDTCDRCKKGMVPAYEY